LIIYFTVPSHELLARGQQILLLRKFKEHLYYSDLWET